jgi:cell division protein FtsB
MVQRIVLFSVVSFFMYSMIFSDVGFLRYRKQKKIVEARQTELLLVKNQITHLREKIEKWQSDSFYTQKLAREDLQLSYPGEIVYIVK